MEPQVPAPAEYAALLRTYRLRAGLSLRALAARASINHTLLVRSEAGSRPPASSSEVMALADGLGLDPDDRDTLLAAAGYWPADFLTLGPSDPTLRALASLLARRTITHEGINAVRECVAALVRCVIASAHSPQQDAEGARNATGAHDQPADHNAP